MRGRPHARNRSRAAAGTTPAYAGKTKESMVCASIPRDHPRVCGEDFGQLFAVVPDWGPPPRMRGRPASEVTAVVILGTTPAYAGKTPDGINPCQWWGDHPRVCGEDKRGSFCRMSSKGPPPRMRGRQRRLVLLANPLGTTPAYAGKTLRCVWRVSGGRDHPRVCGEDENVLDISGAMPGPPPRMRGRPHCHYVYWGSEGTTPAYAGKTP